MIGAFGQSYALHNSLVYSYPYKMMDMPPSHLYASIGTIGYYLALCGAFVSLGAVRWVKGYVLPIVPVVICPLIFGLIFEIAFIFSGISHNEMLERNFDGYTGLTVRYEFGYEVLSLLVWGAIVGLFCGLGITTANKVFFKSPTATNIKA